MERYPFKNLLVGADLDGRSDAAVRAAIEMARAHSSHLEIVHAVDIPRPEWVAGDPVDVATMNAEIMSGTYARLETSLKKIFAEAEYESPPLEEILTVSPGSPAEVLLGRARKLDADVIFVGPHRKRGLFDFGGTARAVLAHAPDGVWVQPGEFRPIERILAPVDLSAHSLASLDVACALASAIGASLTVLHSFEPPDFAYAPDVGGYPVGGPTYVLEEVRDGARKAFESDMESRNWDGIDHRHLFEEGKAIPTILEHSKENDLIVLGSHGRTGLSAVVLGNVAYGVLKASEVPVLSLRHPGREWLLSS